MKKSCRAPVCIWPVLQCDPSETQIDFSVLKHQKALSFSLRFLFWAKPIWLRALPCFIYFLPKYVLTSGWVPLGNLLCTFATRTHPEKLSDQNAINKTTARPVAWWGITARCSWDKSWVENQGEIIYQKSITLRRFFMVLVLSVKTRVTCSNSASSQE